MKDIYEYFFLKYLLEVFLNIDSVSGPYSNSRVEKAKYKRHLDSLMFWKKSIFYRDSNNIIDFRSTKKTQKLNLHRNYIKAIDDDTFKEYIDTQYEKYFAHLDNIVSENKIENEYYVKIAKKIKSNEFTLKELIYGKYKAETN